jgi:hypothetical protein
VRKPRLDDPRLRFCQEHGLARFWPDPELVGHWVCYRCWQAPQHAGVCGAFIAVLSRSIEGSRLEQIQAELHDRDSADDVAFAFDVMFDWVEELEVEGPIRPYCRCGSWQGS